MCVNPQAMSQPACLRIKEVFLRERNTATLWGMIFCVGGMCQMAHMWYVCAHKVRARIQMKFHLLQSGCVQGEVCAARCLDECDKDTRRTLWHTGIKLGISYVHRNAPSPTFCYTCNLTHILSLICHLAHSQTLGASCNIKKLLSHH